MASWLMWGSLYSKAARVRKHPCRLAEFTLRCSAADVTGLGRLLFQHGLAFMRHQQIVHIVGMLFLDPQYLLQHALGAGIVIAEIADQLAIMVHRDAFGDQ